MTIEELNQFIKHYIECDKTKSAIMLTAPWGAGKSHYIQNVLVPFLTSEENGSHSCIVVSLYGLQLLYEVSKAIFIECKIKPLAQNSKIVDYGTLAVKTILKGISSAKGIDLSQSPEDMQKLFELINLSGKLIILEDIERSGIDIL